MADRFDGMMARFLQPMDRLAGGPTDAIYLLHRKGGLVFSEGYAHPPGGLYGALIKYPDPNGHIDIFGRKFNWTHRRFTDGRLEIIPYAEQVERQMEILPELRSRPPRPPYAENFCHFLLDEMAGFFDSMRSLDLLVESTPRLAEVIASVEELLEVPRERIGCTGSLAYGYYEEEEEDVDCIFFGTVRENAALIERIRSLKRREPDREVVELGKAWPLRFKHLGTVICPFFKYAREDEIPLRDFRMEVVRGPVTGACTVADDRHTPYLPVVLTVEGVTLDGEPRPPMELVIYDGSRRGEYYRGMRLSFGGRLVRIEDAAGAREALLATTPGEVEIAPGG
ncbi:MAG: hypothetical protein PHN82_04635 [bacterium]|nr:hypothetical protein [bacterium]